MQSLTRGLENYKKKKSVMVTRLQTDMESHREPSETDLLKANLKVKTVRQDKDGNIINRSILGKEAQFRNSKLLDEQRLKHRQREFHSG